MAYTIEDIQTIPEGQTFDCKSIQVSAKSLVIPIVAMANADGGVLAVGVSDTNRRIEGIDQEPKHLNDLLAVPMDLCKPSVKATFSYLPCTDEHGRENRILLIHIPASSRLHTTQNDECYMRVGDKSKKLSFDERLQLMSDKGERNFEDEPVTDAKVDDINMEAVADFVRTIGYPKSPMEYLRENNNFLTVQNGQERVSKACILLFGKYPQRFFQRARTRFIRYDGTEERFGREMNVIKDVTFEGTILEQVRRTIDYLETQVREHSFLGEHGQFVTKRNYSKFAIQELVVNSVCHRDYSILGTEIQIKMFDNRIVFETPGNLPGLVRPENIRHTHFSRNPKLALFLKAYKFVKEFGEGVDRICTELEQTGTPLLVFHPNYFILQTTLYEEVIDIPANAQTNTESTQKSTVKEESDLKTTQKSSGKKFGETTLKTKEKPIIEPIAESIVESIVENLSTMRAKIVWILWKNPYATAQSVSKEVGIAPRNVQEHFRKLQDMGIIRRNGGDFGGHWEIIE